MVVSIITNQIANASTIFRGQRKLKVGLILFSQYLAHFVTAPSARSFRVLGFISCQEALTKDVSAVCMWPNFPPLISVRKKKCVQWAPRLSKGKIFRQL